MTKLLIGEITKENIKALIGELVDTHHNGLNNAMSKADDGKVHVSISLGIEFLADGICGLEAGISYAVEKVKDKIERKVNEMQMELEGVDASNADKVYHMGGSNA